MPNEAPFLLPHMGEDRGGEASDDCLPPKRGFPLPTLPHVGKEFYWRPRLR